MRFLSFAGLCTTLLAASPVLAEPKVVTDIPAIQSLVARVMEGVGMPESIVSPDASHHHYDLRPSQARTLAEADIVFWVGEALEPWLAASIESLASDAVAVELMDLPDMLLLEYPDDDDHDDEHGHEHDDDHDDGYDRDDDYDDGHGHDHGDADPHLWLDPRNGQIVMAAAAVELAAIDPDNAGVYSANAKTGIAELEDLMTRTDAILSPVRQMAFMTAHDSYRYFERRFGIEFVMSVADVDAGAPGPDRLQSVKRVIEEENVVCIFIEPQFDAKIVRMVAEGSDARLGVLNVDGTGLETGIDFYPALIEGLAQSLADCPGEPG